MAAAAAGVVIRDTQGAWTKRQSTEHGRCSRAAAAWVQQSHQKQADGLPPSPCLPASLPLPAFLPVPASPAADGADLEVAGWVQLTKGAPRIAHMHKPPAPQQQAAQQAAQRSPRCGSINRAAAAAGRAGVLPQQAGGTSAAHGCPVCILCMHACMHAAAHPRSQIQALLSSCCQLQPPWQLCLACWLESSSPFCRRKAST